MLERLKYGIYTTENLTNLTSKYGNNNSKKYIIKSLNSTKMQFL